MRLKNIYVLCKDNVEKVESIKGSTSSSNSSYTVVTGWGVFLGSYSELYSISFLQDDISNLFNSVPEIYRHQSQFNVSNAEWNKISQNKNKLISSIKNVIKLYESMGLDSEEKIGIDVKLPKCDDFSDFRKCIDELEFVLYRCPFFKIDGEDLKFNTLDVGSMWINFVILGISVGASSIILNNLVAFIDKCLIIRSHKLTVEQQELQLQSMEMEKAEKEKLLSGINKIYEAQVENVISELESETNISLKDGEERGVVSQAFDKANLLLDKGLQIYSTIDSPEEVKALFEPLEMKYISVGNELKQLEKKVSE